MIRVDSAHPHFLRRRVKRILRDLRLGHCHLSEAEDALYELVTDRRLPLEIAEKINLKCIRIVSDRMKGGAM